MNEQISIFDWIPELAETPDINDIPEEEAVRIVGERLGLQFVLDKISGEWQAKKGKLKMGLKYDRFVPGVFGGVKFFGTSYAYGTSGGGSPCDSIESAIRYFRKVMEDTERRPYDEI